MQRQRHQSAIRVWQSNYVNFILEHNENTHEHERSFEPLVVAVLLPTIVIRSIASTVAQHFSITDMPYEQAVTVANSWLGLGYHEADSVTSSGRP